MKILLMRGLVREAGHWGDFPARLSTALGGAQVLTPDLPGNGVLHGERSPTSVGEMVEAARSQAGGGPLVLFAVSLGGMVAVEWATRYPDEIAGLVVANSSLGGLSPFFRRLLPSAWPTIARALRSPVDERERAILGLVANAPPPHSAAEWVKIATERPVARANALRQLVAAARYRAPRQPPRAPSLVVVGDGDRLVSPSCSRAIAAWLGAPLAAHPSAGHDITTDAGDWVASEIAAWLRAKRHRGGSN
jgi:pimeloyl-ACP methyl ester carboxylesterase